MTSDVRVCADLNELSLRAAEAAVKTKARTDRMCRNNPNYG